MQGGHGYGKRGKFLKNEKVDQKLGKSEKCVIGPFFYGDYHKIAVSCMSIYLSVCPSGHPSVSLAFFSGMAHYFFLV